jgi:hypothetical protein
VRRDQRRRERKIMRQLEKQRRRLESRGIFKDLATLRHEWEVKRNQPFPFPVSETSFNEDELDELDDDEEDELDDEIDVEHDDDVEESVMKRALPNALEYEGQNKERSLSNTDDQERRKRVPIEADDYDDGNMKRSLPNTFENGNQLMKRSVPNGFKNDDQEMRGELSTLVKHDIQHKRRSFSNLFEDNNQERKRSLPNTDEENYQEKRKRIPNDVEEKKPVRGGHSAFSIDNLLSHALEKNFKQ